jgi:hypothetical protein
VVLNDKRKKQAKDDQRKYNAKEDRPFACSKKEASIFFFIPFHIVTDSPKGYLAGSKILPKKSQGTVCLLLPV